MSQILITVALGPFTSTHAIWLPSGDQTGACTWLHGSVDQLVVSAILVRNVNLGKLVLAIRRPSQVDKAAAVWRGLGGAVHIVDELPWRTAKDRHHIERVQQRHCRRVPRVK